MTPRLATFALVAAIAMGSCSRETEPVAAPHYSGPAIQAQLLRFYDLGLKYNFDNHGQEYHKSIFVVLSPTSLCGTELVIAHSHLPKHIDDWPAIGFVYRLRIEEAQFDYISKRKPEDSSTTFIYPEPPIVGTIGQGAPDVECF